MSIFNTILKSLPSIAAELIPGGGVIKEIARAVTDSQDDEQAAEVLKADPNLQIEYQKAVLVNIVETAKADNDRLRAENERLATINRTMQIESQSSNILSALWRPIWGIISALAFLVTCCGVFFLAYQGIIKGNSAAMAMIPQLVGMMAPLFAIPGAILGVASWHRGKMQREKADGIQSLLGQNIGQGIVQNIGKSIFNQG